ncbi:MAG: hypothetical protein MUE69_32025 [Myxococcota bacterium]|jgi:hypothetical protein|nr:hypothetical protein [Myxococcota bacterium]
MQERAPEPREPDTDRAASSPAATYVRLFWPPTPRSAPATRGEHAVWEDEGGAILRADEHVETARHAEDPSVAVPSASREGASASQVELRRASPAEISNDSPVEIAGASQAEVASDLQAEFSSNEPLETSSVSGETSVGVAQPLVAFVGTYPPRRCGLATFTADLSGALRAFYRESEAQDGFAEGPRTSRRPHSWRAAASEGRAGGGHDPGGRRSFDGHCPVVAMTDVQHGYEYPADVTFDVAEQSASSYADAIEQLNESDVDAISLQHEYGIFGGECGSLVLGFYRRLRAPIVTTLHTVAPTPNPRQRAIMDEICVRSERLVVMSRGAAELLRRFIRRRPERSRSCRTGFPRCRRERTRRRSSGSPVAWSC